MESHLAAAPYLASQDAAYHWQPYGIPPSFSMGSVPSGYPTYQTASAGSQNISTMAVPYTLPQPAATLNNSEARTLPAARGSDESAHSSESPSPPQGEGRAMADADKKRHACWMCHKSFDRPSTLRKHLLVHTGEKAFACETCGRRFGVSSNLNRHARKCASRPVNQAAAERAAPPPPGASTSAVVDANPSARSDSSAEAGPSSAIVEVPRTNPPPTAAPTRSRKRKAAPPPEMEPTQTITLNPSRAKRVRRAPSPPNWIPDSLKSFDHTDTTKATPVPLPPVQPFQDTDGNILEERDSFDENVSSAPYHPLNWKGRLPGPGLMGRDVANTSGGRLLIF